MAVAYTVYYGTAAATNNGTNALSNGWTQFGGNISGTTQQITGLVASTTYYFQIFALDTVTGITSIDALIGPLTTATGTVAPLGFYGGFPASSTANTQIASFTSVMGRAPTHAICYMAQNVAPNDASQSWTNQSNFLASQMHGNASFTGLIPQLGVPFCYNPGSGQINLFSSIAAGTYDTQIQNMLGAFKTNGFLTMELRPAWEFNQGTFNSVNASNLPAFLSAWKHFYTFVKTYATNNGMTINVCWCPNIGPNTNSSTLTFDTNATTGQYPGDAFVDVIGIDTYSFSAFGFTDPNIAVDPTNKNYYVKTMIAMAAAASPPKAIGLGEVGTDDDNITFVNSLVSVLTNCGVHIQYVCLFEPPGPDNIGGSQNTQSFSNSGEQPGIAAAWKAGLGPTGSIINTS